MFLSFFVEVPFGAVRRTIVNLVVSRKVPTVFLVPSVVILCTTFLPYSVFVVIAVKDVKLLLLK